MTPPDPLPAPTPRLEFRPWAERDLPLALALWGDPEVTRYIGGPLDEERVRERLRQEIASRAAHGVQYWPVFLRESGEHAGCCGLRPYGTEGGVFELGFQLRPACWGRGYGEEAARAVLDLAFHALGARAIFAGHHPANEASRRLLARLGFRYSHDELYPPTGLRHPSYWLRVEERG